MRDVPARHVWLPEGLWGYIIDAFSGCGKKENRNRRRTTTRTPALSISTEQRPDCRWWCYSNVSYICCRQENQMSRPEEISESLPCLKIHCVYVRDFLFCQCRFGLPDEQFQRLLLVSYHDENFDSEPQFMFGRDWLSASITSYNCFIWYTPKIRVLSRMYVCMYLSIHPSI